jgi:hypothetical protein
MILDQHEIASVPSAPRLLENSLSVFLGRRRDEPGRERTHLNLFDGRSSAGTDFSEPEIDRFVMAITAAEAIVRHTAPHQTA